MVTCIRLLAQSSKRTAFTHRPPQEPRVLGKPLSSSAMRNGSTPPLVVAKQRNGRPRESWQTPLRRRPNPVILSVLQNVFVAFCWAHPDFYPRDPASTRCCEAVSTGIRRKPSASVREQKEAHGGKLRLSILEMKCASSYLPWPPYYLNLGTQSVCSV